MDRHELDVSAVDMKAWQREDATLKEIWEVVHRCEVRKGIDFFTCDGLLYSCWISRSQHGEAGEDMHDH